jgi:hypothetical protein
MADGQLAPHFIVPGIASAIVDGPPPAAQKRVRWFQTPSSVELVGKLVHGKGGVVEFPFK